MAKTNLSRKEREKARRRKEILAAALDLYSDSGFYYVSMQELAHASKCAVGTLYNFFKSKDALFREAVNTYEEIGPVNSGVAYRPLCLGRSH